VIAKSCVMKAGTMSFSLSSFFSCLDSCDEAERVSDSSDDDESESSESDCEDDEDEPDFSEEDSEEDDEEEELEEESSSWSQAHCQSERVLRIRCRAIFLMLCSLMAWPVISSMMSS